MKYDLWPFQEVFRITSIWWLGQELRVDFESIIAARAINTRPAVSLTFYVERNAIDDRVTCH